jgi:IclR family transcriptional regulator, KDG regulon repressor
MSKKYWVPAIERANRIIQLVAQKPSQLRLIDISKELEINKSSMYSLLHTLEEIGWLEKEKGETYRLGSVLGSLSTAYFKQFDLLQTFSAEAVKSVKKIDEHIQLGMLQGSEVLYLAREEGTSPARLVTDPGSRYPAYASAIGKIQLIKYSYEELKELFAETELEPKTPNTITDIDELWSQIQQAKQDGFVYEIQEGAIGFCCVAAPVYNHENKLIAGVSFTMLESSWNKKRDAAREEIINLASSLSKNAGQSSAQ